MQQLQLLANTGVQQIVFPTCWQLGLQLTCAHVCTVLCCRACNGTQTANGTKCQAQCATGYVNNGTTTREADCRDGIWQAPTGNITCVLGEQRDIPEMHHLSTELTWVAALSCSHIKDGNLSHHLNMHYSYSGPRFS
jgi:hypothetical protein